MLEVFQNISSGNIKLIVAIVAILLLAVILTRTMRWIFNKYLIKGAIKLNTDPTRYKFLRNALAAIIWTLALAAIILLIPKLKTLAVTLFAGAGILIAIMGFAAQQAFSNIISGVFIVLFKPFRIGDMIKVGTQQYGLVEDITLRHTVINNFENKRIIIPNSVISAEVVINDSIADTKICRFIEIGISYDSDTDLATDILQEEAAKHPLSVDGRSQAQVLNDDPIVVVRLIAFADSSVNLRAYVWTKDPLHALEMHSDINRAIKKRFDAEGITIPFPHRTVYHKNFPEVPQKQDGPE